ncbi:MAG: protein kinase [Planctomycetes bacterium]|nr:protein kinase [Planctomycetota bacterium]
MEEDATLREVRGPIPLGEPIDGAYRPIKILGRGGMGIVYLAQVDLEKMDLTLLVAYREKGRGESREEEEERRQTRLAKWARRSREELLDMIRSRQIPLPDAGVCALKLLTAPHLIHRFEAEWKGLLSVHHANLIPVYGGGVASGFPYYVMEYVPDPLPIDRLSKELLLVEKLRIAADAARGLSALHQKGIIHRDVKVSNLLVSRGARGELVTRISDLGLGKDTARAEGFTATHDVMGTPHYMSPEQLRSSRDVDPRSDVYSLGGVLYSLIARRPPYHGQGVAEIARAVLSSEPPEPVSRFAPATPREVVRLVERMMSFDPYRRPGSMEEVVTLLEGLVARATDGSLATVEIVEGETIPLAERPASGGRTGVRSGRRSGQRRKLVRPRGWKPWAAFALGVAATALAFGLGISLLAGGDGTSPSPTPTPGDKGGSSETPGEDGDTPGGGLGPGPRDPAAVGGLRAEIEDARRLAASQGNYRRALAEIDRLARRAEALGESERLAGVRRDLALAEEKAFGEFLAELGLARTPEEREKLLQRRVLFPESRSSAIEEEIARLDSRTRDPIPPRPNAQEFMLRLQELLAAHRYRETLEAWREWCRLVPEARHAPDSPHFDAHFQHLADFHELVLAGGEKAIGRDVPFPWPDENGPARVLERRGESVLVRLPSGKELELPVHDLPLPARLALVGESGAEASRATLAALSARGQEKDPAFLDAYLAARGQGLNPSYLDELALAAVQVRLASLIGEARTAHQDPAKFLARVEAFRRPMLDARNLLSPMEPLLDAWTRCARAAEAEAKNPYAGTFAAVLAYGPDPRQRPARVTGPGGAPLPLLHDLDEGGAYEQPSGELRVRVEFEEPTMLGGIQVIVNRPVRVVLHGGEPAAGSAATRTAIASGTADPARPETLRVQEDRRSARKIYVAVLAASDGGAFQISEMYLLGYHQRFVSVEVKVDLWTERLTAGGFARARAMAKLTYDPDFDLGAVKAGQVRWTSNAWHVAVVDETGLVTALGPGTAEISAAFGNVKSVPAHVTVEE